MNKKEIIIPFFVIGLTLIFASISFAVFITNGKSKKWVARKMKIGGILLTLTAASCNGGGGGVTCYDVAEINSMWINNTSQNGIELKLDTGNILKGSISTIDGKDFSFQVADSVGSKYQKGLILLDSISNYSSSFKIELDKNLKPGKYKIKLFASNLASQDTIEPNREFDLTINNE